MIVGQVNEHHEPLIPLVVVDARGQQRSCDGVVDTGFNGWLSLPPALIADLGLAWLRMGSAVLADGSETLFDVYEGRIVWDGEPRTIPIDESDSEPLVGMQLMDGFELRVQAVVAGSVMLDRMK